MKTLDKGVTVLCPAYRTKALQKRFAALGTGIAGGGKWTDSGGVPASSCRTIAATLPATASWGTENVPAAPWPMLVS